MCLLKYVFKCEQKISFFVFRSGLTVTGLARVYTVERYRLNFKMLCGVFEGGTVNHNSGNTVPDHKRK
jgi:hypothetical protein